MKETHRGRKGSSTLSLEGAGRLGPSGQILSNWTPFLIHKPSLRKIPLGDRTGQRRSSIQGQAVEPRTASPGSGQLMNSTETKLCRRSKKKD